MKGFNGLYLTLTALLLIGGFEASAASSSSSAVEESKVESKDTKSTATEKTSSAEKSGSKKLETTGKTTDKGEPTSSSTTNEGKSATTETTPVVTFKECKVHCVEPLAACTESERVIETLEMIYQALSKQDFATVAEYMDESCTTIDEASHKVVSGKEAVLTDLKDRISKWSHSDSPLVAFTIERPFAHVTGDTAVVTFKAIKEFGGKHPQKFVSRCTDIFVKRGDKWKKMHYRSKWKQVS